MTHPNHRQQWRPPPPRDLPEVRGKLATWLAEWGADFYCAMALSGSQQVFPDAPDRITGAVRLAAAERQRVVDAELYWVSGEMTELAVHGGRRLTRFELYEHDLPSPTGFIMFAEPIAAWRQHGVTVEIVAASWGLIRPPLLAGLGAFDTQSRCGLDRRRGLVNLLQRPTRGGLRDLRRRRELPAGMAPTDRPATAG